MRSPPFPIQLVELPDDQGRARLEQVGHVPWDFASIAGPACKPITDGSPDRNAANAADECGRPLEVHDRHVRFGMPDPVLEAPDQDRVNGASLSHGDANSSVMMQTPGVGSFVRALLPVDLTGGYTVTFGVWVGVDPDEL
jgi:hypothetical protein